MATAEFRAVLHEWARRQLEERSWHVGPFEIIDVRLEYDPGFGGSDVTPPDPSITDVVIRFHHTSEGCDPGYLRLGGRYCAESRWSPGDSQNTVTMLNELLAIADGRDQP